MKTSDILCKFIKMSNRVRYHDDFKQIQKQNTEILNTPGTGIAFVFDIDQTLYTDYKLNKAETEHIEGRKSELKKKHKITDPIYWEDEFKKAGSSKIFLKKKFNMSLREVNDYWEFKDFKDHLKPDYDLKEKIDRIEGVKICFTNGMKDRAEEVLRLLGLTDCFTYILCADDEQEDYYLKPKEKAFEFVEDFLGLYVDKSETVKNIIFFDDSKANIDTAIKQKWGAVRATSVDHVKNSLDILYGLQTGKITPSEALNMMIIDSNSDSLKQILKGNFSGVKFSLNNGIRQNPCIASA